MRMRNVSGTTFSRCTFCMEFIHAVKVGPNVPSSKNGTGFCTAYYTSKSLCWSVWVLEIVGHVKDAKFDGNVTTDVGFYDYVTSFGRNDK